MTATDQKREKKLSNNGQGGYLPVAARKLNLVEVFFAGVVFVIGLRSQYGGKRTGRLEFGVTADLDSGRYSFGCVVPLVVWCIWADAIG